MDKPLIAITIHRVPQKEVCGVIILEKQPDRSWTGTCNKCGKEFHVEPNPTFEIQVQAVRN